MVTRRPAIVAVSRFGWPAGQTARLILSQAIEFAPGHRTPAYDGCVRCNTPFAWLRALAAEAADAALETPATAAITVRQIRASITTRTTTQRSPEVPRSRQRCLQGSAYSSRVNRRGFALRGVSLAAGVAIVALLAAGCGGSSRSRPRPLAQRNPLQRRERGRMLAGKRLLPATGDVDPAQPTVDRRRDQIEVPAQLTEALHREKVQAQEG